MKQGMGYTLKRLKPHFESESGYKYKCCICGKVFTTKKKQKPLFKYTNLKGEKQEDYYCKKHKSEVMFDFCGAMLMVAFMLFFVIGSLLQSKDTEANSLKEVHSCSCVCCEKKGTTARK